MDNEFYELCYEAWMTWHSPNDVSINEYDRLQSKGYSPDEISLNMVLPSPKWCPLEDLKEAKSNEENTDL